MTNPRLDLASLKGSLQLLTREQRKEIREYLDALDAYEDSGEWAAEWGIVQGCVKEITGERWSGLGKLKRDIRNPLERKLADAQEIANQMHLTPVGRSRMWFIYLKGLADVGQPLTPRTLALWTVSLLSFIHQNLPYNRELQSRILNDGLRD